LSKLIPLRAAGFGIDIRDRRGSDERPFEGIDRSDVRQSRTHLDHQPHADLGEIGAAAGYDLARAGQIVDGRGRDARFSSANS
jgi:hypothetical protein